MSEYERCDNGRIRFNNVFWCVYAKFAPGDFLVWHGTAVTSIAGRRVADLAKVTPERHIFALQILVQHGYDTNWKITCDAPANLEHSQRALLRGPRIEIGEPGHVLD